MSIESPENCIFLAPELAYDKRIPDLALRIYGIINRLCASGKGADISATRIAELMGRRANTVKDHVRLLIRFNMIGRMTKPGKSGGKVVVLWTEPPEHWTLPERADSERAETAPPNGRKPPRRPGGNRPFAIERARPIKQDLQSKGRKAARWVVSREHLIEAGYPEDWLEGTEELLDAWNHIRKAKRAATTIPGLKSQRSQLEKAHPLDKATFHAVLEQAVREEWKGLYPLKDGPKGSTATGTNDYDPFAS